VAQELIATEIEDGRRARRDRNRNAVVDALLEVYRDGNLDPSSDEIASRAGLSPRSLFRYFDDIDDLCRAAITRQQDRVRPLIDVAVASDSSLPTRIEALVEQRVRLFEAIGTVGQVSRLRAPFQPLIAAELTQAREFLRHQIKKTMGAELGGMGAHRAANMVAAADVLCSYEAYQLLRFDQSLSRARVVSVLTESLLSLFGPEES
jgi:AcrR family transcriptional regulator